MSASPLKSFGFFESSRGPVDGAAETLRHRADIIRLARPMVDTAVERAALDMADIQQTAPARMAETAMGASVTAEVIKPESEAALYVVPSAAHEPMLTGSVDEADNREYITAITADDASTEATVISLDEHRAKVAQAYPDAHDKVDQTAKDDA